MADIKSKGKQLPEQTGGSKGKEKNSGNSKLARPNEAQYKNEQDALDAKIEKLNKAQRDLEVRIRSAQNVNPQKQELIAERTKISIESKSIREEKDRLSKSVEERKKFRDMKFKEAESIKEKLGPYKSIEKVDQTIKEYENKIRIGNLSLLEEKKYVTEISNLKKARKSLELYQKKIEEVDKDKKEFEELKEKMTQKNEEYKKYHDKISAITDKLDQITKAQEQDKQKVTQLIEDKNQLRSQIDDLYKKKTEIYVEYKEKNAEFRAFQQEEIKRNKEEKKILGKQKLEEKKRMFEEKRREERLKPKYVDEIAAAGALIQYLQVLQNAKSASSTTSNSTNSSAQITGELPDGAVVLKSKAERDSADDFFAPKPKANKQKQKSEPKKSDTLTFSLDTIDQFMMLQVSLPSVSGDIERALEQLQEKKTHFEAKQKEELEKALKEIEEEQAAEAKAEQLTKSQIEETEIELEKSETPAEEGNQASEETGEPEPKPEN